MSIALHTQEANSSAAPALHEALFLSPSYESNSSPQTSPNPISGRYIGERQEKVGVIALRSTRTRGTAKHTNSSGLFNVFSAAETDTLRKSTKSTNRLVRCSL
ncbi:unnamed protein product [Cylicocyclus nassatus]|uniref:Uncharacterized protein n=1 Tax=Cylicocyclus nassatus TaxID=53992 RepID=A0AA36HC67_CYLNA|nr:unnamed protein product [Cylicocyclus nassatus]